MYLGIAVPIVISFGIIISFGTYIFYQLICYLKEKPHSLQTLLDGIYKQYFQIVVIRVWCVGIIQTALMLSLKLPWYVIYPFGWMEHYFGSLLGLHLLLCLLVKYLLIHKPEAIEDISDDDFCMWSL